MGGTEALRESTVHSAMGRESAETSRQRSGTEQGQPVDEIRPSIADTASAMSTLGELSQLFAAELPARLEELAAAYRAIEVEGTPAADRARRLAHGLSGSGATFGMPEVTAMARELDALLADIAKNGRERLLLSNATVLRLLAELNRIASVRLSMAPSPSQPPEQRSGGWMPYRSRHAALNSVGVLETDAPEAHAIASQLVHFGYEVRVIPGGEDLSPTHLRGLAATICDLRFAERLRSISPTMPLVGMLARDDLALRLQAVRSGFSALVSRPCDAGELARALERLTPFELAPSERVLIVDDDGRLARAYALTLEQGGMVVSVLEDPMLLLERVVEFQPEIILMDLYLPQCTGLELAAVLRQDDRVVGVPIVFLTSETRPTSALAALEVGADDFLSKPVAPERLISVVRARIDRARVVRSFMDRDSLTGLLNHSRTLERFEQELARARRRASPFCLVLLDLDHFKHVNDVHGHVVGDRVLKSLAVLLRQRLRRSDTIGRCGGEEFAVLLPDTAARDAVHVIDGLRQRFGELSHATHGPELCTTFSAGIASSQDFGGTSSLWEAADAALYAAKGAGRNTVKLADEHTLQRRMSLPGPLPPSP